jgi:hypothetical protein
VKGFGTHIPQEGHGGNGTMKRGRCLVALLVFGGCNAEHSLGRIDQDSGPDLPTADSVAQASTQLAPDANGGPDSTPVGSQGSRQSWTGYVENHLFPSGSDAIRLLFATDSIGQIVGAAMLGEGVPPSPSTDPNVGYPPAFAAAMTSASGYWVEGYSYSMINGKLSSGRLRFSVRSNELWTGWCELQTPVNGSNACVPNWPASCSGVEQSCVLTNPVNGQSIIVDWGKFQLCGMYSSVCLCSEAACVADLSGGGAIDFDLTISGGQATGSAAGVLSGNVHFTREP